MLGFTTYFTIPINRDKIRSYCAGRAMNREIIVGILTGRDDLLGHDDLPDRCDHKDRSDPNQQFDGRTLCSLCRNINRDLPILVAKVRGARATIDVGLSVTTEEGLSPYEPYRRAGFRLFKPSGTTEIDRITESFQEAFARGYESVVLLFHGVPNLPLSYIEQALVFLREEGEVVLGPLKNGGFYLIGCTQKTFNSECFSELLPNLSFCNKGRKKEALKKIDALGIHLSLLPEWYQVKTPSDLKRLCEERGNGIVWNGRWTQHTSDDLI